MEGLKFTLSPKSDRVYLKFQIAVPIIPVDVKNYLLWNRFGNQKPVSCLFRIRDGNI